MNLSKEHTEFAKLVQLMRQKQKDYFRGRNIADMQQAKHYERLVDKQLEALNPPTPNPQKPLL